MHIVPVSFCPARTRITPFPKKRIHTLYIIGLQSVSKSDVLLLAGLDPVYRAVAMNAGLLAAIDSSRTQHLMPQLLVSAHGVVEVYPLSEAAMPNRRRGPMYAK